MARRLRHGPIGALARAARITAAIVRQRRRAHRVYARMPKPASWEWAKERLVPLLAGPYFDTPGEELVRCVVEPGLTVAFGIDLGGVAPYVDAQLAERWECSAQQIGDAALGNLSRRAANIPADWVQSGTLSGYPVRILERPRAWAASVVLVKSELERLFGTDQIIGAPGQGKLIGAPTRMPGRVFAELLTEYEMEEPYPLLLDPFVLCDGELAWGGAARTDDEVDDEAW